MIAREDMEPHPPHTNPPETEVRVGMITRDDIEAQARQLEEAVHQSLGLIRTSIIKASIGMVGKGAVKWVAKRRTAREKAAASKAAEAEENTG